MEATLTETDTNGVKHYNGVKQKITEIGLFDTK